MHNYLYLISRFAWPIAAVAVMTLLAWWLCSDLRPIVTGIIQGIATHAQKNVV